MPPAPPPFAPGTLAALAASQVRAALAAGALRPIPTEAVTVRDGGMRFVVRHLPALAAKPRPDWSGPPRDDPFLPPEPPLTVASVPPDHVIVLNKFPVLPGHLLLVTRGFEHQERLLRPGDLEALWRCMAEIPGLGFYNGGVEAGASQPHKHLQLAPYPLGAGEDLPLAALAAEARGERVPGLPFRHAFARLPALPEAPAAAAGVLHALYRALLEAAGVGVRAAADGERQGRPYNLLLTREWMLLVPRSRERYAGVSVNGLGFAGSLFAPDRAGLARLLAARPMTVLRAVADPP
ncbi:DUF4922 domain-containing protein [Inmirania thermothiophila]|uniref:ATP adenylyltransferase n=1 Tax=Inmirania thermothiophila TaxID=1750597 RepID=A0A3N1YAM4_9GAMM|nr:DUF4922 domain-containing protein [Inmirania thermothiophila]ROR34437.1 ATP adenylyltransferase [Inmirania thermothiophila]